MKQIVSSGITNYQSFTLAGDRRFPVFAGNSRSEMSPHTFLTVSKVCSMISKLVPLTEVAEDQIISLLRSAWEASEAVFSEQDALVWADGYRFPSDIAVRDTLALKAVGYDLSALVKQRQCEMRHDRLSLSRIDHLGFENKDTLLLREMVVGMEIVVDATFVPNGKPPPMRRKYLRLAPAVNKILFDLHQEGHVLIVPTEVANTIPGIHYSSTHWAPKAGKPQGRQLGDPSNVLEGSALNSDSVRAMVTAKWGEIHHPTLDDLVLMILRISDRHGKENVVMWKMDLKGAFNLLFIRPEDVKLMAFQLTDDLTMFYMTGMFGWTGTPAAFQVVTRVITCALGRMLRGAALMYVDDIMGVCQLSDLTQDMDLARGVCESLLGPNAIASKKTESGRQIEWIGWLFDLELWTVSMSTRNFLKTLHGFYTVDVSQKVSMKTIEKLASWASRYASICRCLKPFTGDLHAEKKGLRNRNITKFLLHPTRLTICLWRAFLCLMELSGSIYRRSLDTFVIRPAEYAIEYDASLSGFGVIVYRNMAGSAWKVTRGDFPFLLGSDSSYQNTAEFIAVVVGVALLVRKGFYNGSIRLKGDNVSSLRWGKDEKFKPGRSRRAVMVYMAICLRYGINVETIEHVEGVNNTICDAMSRGQSAESVGFHSHQVVQFDEDIVLLKIIKLCEPATEKCDDDDNQFMEFWGDTQKAVEALGLS